MKLSLVGSSLALAISTTRGAEALLEDCDIQISRQSDAGGVPAEAACAHFEGINAEPYRSWYDANAIASKYTSMVYLQGSDASQPENGAAIHWKVDGDSLYLAVAARATGWLGFGIGEAGGMLGADMALFEAAKPDVIVDAFTTDERFPQPDDCGESDWDLLSSNIDDEGGFIMIEFKRLLDTNDPQDKKIFNDAATLVPAHRVIAAWGDSPEVGYHGLNRARGAIRFYGSGDDRATFDKAMEANAEGTFVVASIDHEIPALQTEYAYTCVSRDDMIEQGVLNTTDFLNIIGFEPLIQQGNEAYVHHYILSGHQEADCNPESFGEIAYVWAPGEGPLSFPDNMGSPLFGEDGFQSFMIEVHYNNPQLNTGVMDNSGVRVFWTSTSREEQIGIMSVGDPLLGLMDQPVGDGLSYHSFECPGSCSALATGGESVTVLREYLHMHETGARMVNEQIRDGQVIREATVEYWEFDQNGNAAVQQNPYELQAGDGFKTSCYFSGEGRVFGLASSEEMCMAFLYYYPRTKIRVEEENFEFPWFCGFGLEFPPCEATHESTLLSGIDDLDRTFGTSSGETCDDDATTDGEPNVGGSPVDPNVEGGDDSGAAASSGFGMSLLGLAAYFSLVLSF